MNYYEKVADFIVSKINHILEQKGGVSLCLSGGNTPKHIYEQLVKKYSTFKGWDKTEFYFGDERVVPYSSEFNNFKNAEEFLFKPLNLNYERVFKVELGEEHASHYARNYEKMIVGRGLDGGFDIIILGMGSDLHTASIFPGNKEALYGDRLFVNTSIPPLMPRVERITISMPFINRSENIIMVAKGADKKKAFDYISDKKIKNDDRFPVSFLAKEKTTFLIEN